MVYSVQWDAARGCRSSASSMRVLRGTIMGRLHGVHSDHVALRGSYVVGSNTMLSLHTTLNLSGYRAASGSKAMAVAARVTDLLVRCSNRLGMVRSMSRAEETHYQTRILILCGAHSVATFARTSLESLLPLTEHTSRMPPRGPAALAACYRLS